MSLDHEKFMKISEGLRNLAMTIAVIVGGLWTAYVFNAELHIENAQATLDKLKLEASSAPSIDKQLDVEQLFVPGDSAYYLHISVQGTNTGNKSTTLNILKEPIKVAEVTLNNSEKPKFKIVATTDYYSPEGSKTANVVIGAGETNKIPFVVKVNHPGLYLIEFEAQMESSDLTESIRAGADPRFPTTWVAQKYVVVK